METLINLAIAMIGTIYVVVLMVNVWQAIAGYNLPWSRAVAVLMMIALLLFVIALALKEA